MPKVSKPTYLASIVFRARAATPTAARESGRGRGGKRFEIDGGENGDGGINLTGFRFRHILRGIAIQDIGIVN